MASQYAFVTLVTSDYYLPGALTLAAALRDVHPSPSVPPEIDFQTVCVVTPETVDVSTIKLLRKAFDTVIGVEVIAQTDPTGLNLLGRPDLNTVLTKLHIFRLTQYSKIIFLDADVLPVRPLSHLFSIPHEFSAAPDVGWPDIFNSGVLVFSPGQEKFDQLNAMLKSKGTWDGGDQGILNEWRGQDWNRISFAYNTTPTAAYTYAPAYERFGSSIKAIHFIGPNKPWSHISNRAPQTSVTVAVPQSESQRAYDYNSLLDRWFAVYDRHYRAQTTVPDSEFEVKKYLSAWNEDSPAGADMMSAPGTVSRGGGLGLTELRDLALRGLASNAMSSHSTAGEGNYYSMPLEGRVDLMRPQLARPAKDHGEGAPGDSQEDPKTPVARNVWLQTPTGGVAPAPFPTPGPNEVPPAPHMSNLSLPSTPTPQHSHQYAQYHGQSGSVPQPSLLVPLPPQFYVAPQHTSQQTSQHGSQQYIPSSQPSAAYPQQQTPGQPQYHDQSQQHTSQTSSQQQYYHQPTAYPSTGQQPQIYPSPDQQPNYALAGPQYQGQPAYQKANFQPQSPAGQPSQLGSHQPGSQHSAHQAAGTSHPTFAAPTPQHGWSQGPPSVSAPPPPPPRQASPPMMLWNPAVEPPPNAPPPSTAFSSEPYFPNVWDQSPSKEHDRPPPGGSPTLSQSSSSFFQPPPTPNIPESLRMQGHYRHVTGESDAPSPDRSKVKPIFPWEEKPRHLPARVFPDSEAPPLSMFIASSPPPVQPSPSQPSPTQSIVSPSSALSPLRGLPVSLNFVNAWDTVPSIQTYASKLVRPPKQTPPLAQAFDEEEYRRSKSDDWEGGSRDGDDEDEGDDDDDDDSGFARDDSFSVGDDSDTGSSSRRRRRLSGASNVSDAVPPAGKQSMYQTRGVQTIPKETRNMGVQVNTIQATTKQPAGKIAPSKPERSGLSKPMVNTSGARQPVYGTGSPGTGSPRVQSRPDSPMKFTGGRPVTGPVQAATGPSPTSAANAVPRASPPSAAALPRQISNDSSLGSPASSLGPISPPEGQSPLLGRMSPGIRKASRVWDPTRSVDVFKRGSEEVLARFLKMGSWEDENPETPAGQ